MQSPKPWCALLLINGPCLLYNLFRKLPSLFILLIPGSFLATNTQGIPCLSPAKAVTRFCNMKQQLPANVPGTGICGWLPGG
jgi:hypothetical protein